MRVVTRLTLSNVRNQEELIRYASQDISGIADVINGGLDFTNFRSTTIDVTFTAADTSQQITHKLGKIPTGYLVVKKSVSMVVYDGTMDPTEQDIFLKSSAIGTARLIIF